MTQNVKISNRKDNSLNFIRLLAAFNVFYGHCTDHLEISTVPVVNSIISCFQGVPIFFILSGFLLWDSISRAPDLKTFASKRILRLYPELWGAVLLNLVVMVVMYRDSISWAPFILFTITQSTILQFWTPTSLRGYGVGCPNGALWTICSMVQCYVVLWFLHKVIHKAKAKVWVIIIVIGIALNIFMPMTEPLYSNEILYKLSMHTFLPYIWLFLIGAFISEFFDTIISTLTRFWYLFFAASVLFCLTGFDISGEYATLKCLFLAPAIIGFGYRLSGIKIKHDLSYGFYLFHMVVINAMVHLNIMRNPVYFFIACALSIILAAMSYFTIGAISRSRKQSVEAKIAKSKTL